ncbi:MAG: 50S ribosomal protein L29 [Planctomycetes bacterium]|nr:50S ribosomal protein L29 [Planctomycetota bacterium]NUQ35616.1 50S ribosomal protein L29 [Planctomycetaceae bacterium]
MTIKEIREKKSDDLHGRLRELSEQLFRVRCTSERLTPQKGAEAKKLDQEVARIRTILRQRDLIEGSKKEFDGIEAALKQAAPGSAKSKKLLRRKNELKRVRHEMDVVKGK